MGLDCLVRSFEVVGLDGVETRGVGGRERGPEYDASVARTCSRASRYCYASRYFVRRFRAQEVTRSALTGRVRGSVGFGRAAGA